MLNPKPPSFPKPNLIQLALLAGPPRSPRGGAGSGAEWSAAELDGVVTAVEGEAMTAADALARSRPALEAWWAASAAAIPPHKGEPQGPGRHTAGRETARRRKDRRATIEDLRRAIEPLSRGVAPLP